MATKCIRPKPCHLWIEKEQHCCASFVKYEECVHGYIDEMKAASDEEATMGDHNVIPSYQTALKQIDSLSRPAGSPVLFGLLESCVYNVRRMRARLDALEALLPRFDEGGCYCSHMRDDDIPGKCVYCQLRELLEDKRWRR